MSMRMLHLQNETNASCPDLRGQNYRASFHTHSSAKGPRKKIYHGHLDGEGPRKGEHAVVKVFRDASGTESMCDAEIAKHKLARQWARKFNKLVPDDHWRISFTLPLKSTVERIGVGCYLTRHKTRHMDKKEWVLIEENLIRQGDYQVFIRKTGERLSNDPTTLDAYLHFTYHESGGKYIMCGFQGVQTESGYLLTTPCIHSVDVSFGASTDKGQKAIRKVFDLHHCNNLCYSFIRPEKCADDNEDDSTSTESDSSKEKSKEKIDSSDDDDDDGDDDDVDVIVGSDNEDKSRENREHETMKKIDIEVVGPANSIVHHNSSKAAGTATPMAMIEEQEESPETRRRSSMKRRGSGKKKEDTVESAHRSNVTALMAIDKRPSF